MNKIYQNLLTSQGQVSCFFFVIEALLDIIYNIRVCVQIVQNIATHVVCVPNFSRTSLDCMNFDKFLIIIIVEIKLFFVL